MLKKETHLLLKTKTDAKTTNFCFIHPCSTSLLCHQISFYPVLINKLLPHPSIVQTSFCSTRLLFNSSIVQTSSSSTHLLFYSSIVLPPFCSIALLFDASFVIFFYCPTLLSFYSPISPYCYTFLLS